MALGELLSLGWEELEAGPWGVGVTVTSHYLSIQGEEQPLRPCPGLTLQPPAHREPAAPGRDAYPHLHVKVRAAPRVGDFTPSAPSLSWDEGPPTQDANPKAGEGRAPKGSGERIKFLLPAGPCVGYRLVSHRDPHTTLKTVSSHDEDMERRSLAKEVGGGVGAGCRDSDPAWA